MTLRLLFIVLMFSAAPSVAASYKDMQAQRPDLFHPETGYRIARQRGPTPDDIPPPSALVTPEQARDLIRGGALVLDVFSAAQSRFDELDGTWLVSEPRLSLPGAFWLPETGRGTLSPEIEVYLADNLSRLTHDDRDHPILVFCVADCWMSWNAAQRIAGLGYTHVHWYRLGTDGWLDIGEGLFPVEPVPVDTD